MTFRLSRKAIILLKAFEYGDQFVVVSLHVIAISSSQGWCLSWTIPLPQGITSYYMLILVHHLHVYIFILILLLFIVVTFHYVSSYYFYHTVICLELCVLKH